MVILNLKIPARNLRLEFSDLDCWAANLTVYPGKAGLAAGNDHTRQCSADLQIQLPFIAPLC